MLYNMGEVCYNQIGLYGFEAKREKEKFIDAITAFVVINRGVPQGTVLGPTLFSLMVNDIAAVSPMNNLLVKYADDITISVPVRQSTDTAAAEVEFMKKWADINEMSLNFTKTWEMWWRLGRLSWRSHAVLSARLRNGFLSQKNYTVRMLSSFIIL